MSVESKYDRKSAFVVCKTLLSMTDHPIPTDLARGTKGTKREGRAGARPGGPLVPPVDIGYNVISRNAM